MTTSVFDSILLQNSWSTKEMRDIFSDESRIQTWLTVEAALAIEQAELGMIPKEAAIDIVKNAKYDCLDMDYVLEELIKTKHPLVPTVRGLEKACSGNWGEYVHFGVTTQDIIDTGMVLQLKEAFEIIRRDLKQMANSLLTLSEKHKNTPMMGRTLSLQAIPITFGHKTAIWLSELNRHLQRLGELESRMFVGCIVGAVGTKASFGKGADELERAVNTRLGLDTPDISWQPARDRFYEYGSVMGGINATLNKIGNQLLLMAHNEIDEIAEPFASGQVGSSTMPHKRNPAVTENSVTVSNTLKSNIYMLSDITKHEHERDGAVWKMEWKVMPEICLMLSVVLQNLNFTLSGLEVKKDNMLKNLYLLDGYILAERIMFALSDKLGKQTAHEAVYESAMKGIETKVTFKASLMKNAEIMGAITELELDKLLDPTTYVGDSQGLVERAIERITTQKLF